MYYVAFRQGHRRLREYPFRTFQYTNGLFSAKGNGTEQNSTELY